MNLFTGAESDALFGGEVPDAVRQMLATLRGKPRAEIGPALWAAVLSAPRSLPAYYLLYKHLAGQGELEQARKIALDALTLAARQARLPDDWRAARSADADFNTPGPARFWLFTLKALTFIDTRRGDYASARERLARLRDLDPLDGVGYGVVAALLEQIIGARDD